MAITINSTNAQGLINRTNKSLREQSTLFRKIGSGKAIESAKDNAAMLAIATSMSSEIRGFNQAQRNVNDGISMLQVAEGGLSQVQDAQQRIRELAVQASNGTLTDSDRAAIQLEVDQLQSQISDVVSQTEFNTKNILSSGETVDFQAGANQGQTISHTFTDYSAAFTNVDVSTQAGASSALATLDADINTVADGRSELGALMNRLESSANNLANAAENTSAARSRIQDADMAMLTAQQTSAAIRTQAGIAVQIQARQTSAAATQLLGG